MAVALLVALTSLQIKRPVLTVRKFVHKANYAWSVCKEEKRAHLFKTGRCGADKGRHMHRVTAKYLFSYCNHPPAIWDKFWHPYKETQNIVLHILLFIFLGHKQENRFQSIPQLQYASNYLCMQFFLISAVPKYTNFATYSKVLLSAFVSIFKDLHRTTTIRIYIIYLGNKEIYIL